MTNPTGEEVRELKSRADELLAVFSREGRHAYRPFDCDEVKLVATLCRHFLASQQPMTAGEFAGLVVRHFKDQEDNARGRIKTTKSKSWADHYLECIETAQHASRQLETVAREHNVTIVEPKK